MFFVLLIILNKKKKTNMAYTEAQKDAIIRQRSFDWFAFGIRQYPAGLNGDTYPVYFDRTWKKNINAQAYLKAKSTFRDICDRMQLNMVIVNRREDAFLEIEIVQYVDPNNTNRKGYIFQELIDAAGRYKKKIQYNEDVINNLNGNGGKENERLARYVFRHEVLHSIGLEHPDDSRDGDTDLSLDVFDTDMDYVSTNKEYRAVTKGEISAGRIGGSLDRRVIDTRLIQLNARDYGAKYTGPFL